MKYKIIRMFAEHSTIVVKKNVTLEEAQKHCSDPETSYASCTTKEGKDRTEKYGPWFDGYDEM